MINKRLKALIEQIPRVANTSWNNPERFALEKTIQQHGSEAIPLLLPYLKHPHPSTRSYAASIPGEIQGLNPTHLDALLAYERLNPETLTMAIARIGTPKAIAFLAEEIQKEKHTQSPLGSAFKFLGRKGVPALCHLLRSAPSIDNNLTYELSILMQGLDETAKKIAVKPLLDIVMDNRVPQANRQSALRVLGELGSVARPCVALLLQLAKQEPAAIQEPVDDALLAIGVPEAVPGRLRNLTKTSDRGWYLEFALRDIGSLREQGISAGPAVVKYFDHPDWNARRTAAEVIGFIGFREAIPYLIRFLSNKDDWQLVWVSIQSLVRLRVDEAQNALQKVANQHWFPPVRKLAEEGMVSIRSNRYADRTPPTNFRDWNKRRFGFATYEHPLPYKENTPEPEDHIGSQIDVPGGTLVGRDIGEFGGELTFIAQDGTERVVLENNIQAITRFGTGIFAMSGLAHLSMNEGSVYQVTRNASGQWTATRWRRLPGAPDWAALRNTANGQVLRVGCIGGDVEISPDGTMSFIG